MDHYSGLEVELEMLPKTLRVYWTNAVTFRRWCEYWGLLCQKLNCLVTTMGVAGSVDDTPWGNSDCIGDIWE